MYYGKKVSMRVEQDKAYLLEILNIAPRFTARHYRHTFEKAIDKKEFGKRFFSNMFLSRSQLGRWCTKHKEPFPAFWFPDNEKYPFSEVGDISDEITVAGRYRVQLIYDDTEAVSATQEPPEESVVCTVNENAFKAAQAKHAATNAIKSRFVEFYRAESGNYPSFKAAAEYFFDYRMDKREQLQFVRRESAIRTLLDKLRTDLKQGQ